MEDWLYYFNAYRVPAQHLVAVLLAASAWRWGGAPERWLTGTFLATMVVPVYLIRWFWPERTAEDPFLFVHLVVEIIAFAMFLAIALKANRNYPLWIAGFQLVALATHLIKPFWDGVSPLAMVVLITGPSYCQLVLMIAGFIRHTLRERRFGHYREWRIPTPAAGGYGL